MGLAFQVGWQQFCQCQPFDFYLCAGMNRVLTPVQGDHGVQTPACQVKLERIELQYRVLQAHVGAECFQRHVAGLAQRLGAEIQLGVHGVPVFKLERQVGNHPLCLGGHCARRARLRDRLDGLAQMSGARTDDRAKVFQSQLC